MTAAWIVGAIVVYVAGCAFAAGRTDGIRDGAEGLADEAVIFGWPVYVTFWLLSRPFVWIYKLGRRSSS